MRKSWAAILVLVIVSPVFGVYLADMVGYHEPLDLAAERLGLKDLTDRLNWTPFKDYSVPGLPAWLGYIISGLIGVAAVATLGSIVVKASGGRNEPARELPQGSGGNS